MTVGIILMLLATAYIIIATVFDIGHGTPDTVAVTIGITGCLIFIADMLRLLQIFGEMTKTVTI